MAKTPSPIAKRLWFQPGDSISTPADRARAWAHFHLIDHAWLRLPWTNMDEIAPGVWRSNQPSPGRIAKFAKMGIRSILNLRGPGVLPHYLFEAEACARHGITLIDYPMAARNLLPKETYLGLLDIFETIERPLALHCKSGADRAGLASALWLIHMEGQTPEAAKAMLSLRYVHLKATKTGVLDHLLDAYARDHMQTGIALRDWFETRYDRDALMASFTPRWKL